MSEGKRPGGLTALAVLNFIGTALGVLSALGLAWWIAVINVPKLEEALPKTDDMRQALERIRDFGTVGLAALIAVEAVVTLLLLLSGVGYLRQKAFLGRTLGNAYAIVSVAATTTKLLMVKTPEAGGGFQLITLVLVLYPVLTLILINTTFKDDFVH